MNIFSRNRFDGIADGLRHRLADFSPGVKRFVLAAVLVALVSIGWLGSQGLTAKSKLEKAGDSVGQAKDSLRTSKSEDATRFAENAQFHARQALAATHSVPSNIAGSVSFVGSSLKTSQQIFDVAVGVTDNVLLSAAKMGAGISPGKSRFKSARRPAEGILE